MVSKKDSEKKIETLLENVCLESLVIYNILYYYFLAKGRDHFWVSSQRFCWCTNPPVRSKYIYFRNKMEATFQSMYMNILY